MSVAVVIPYYSRELSPDQEASLRVLRRFLSGYRICCAAPESFPQDALPFPAVRFGDAAFVDIPSYSKLLLSREFYQRFIDVEYILIYQLDCLVFSNDLDSWCQRRYDYVGAPLPLDKQRPERGFSRAGNGGLSLRRVAAFLRVLNSDRKPALPWDVLTARIGGLEPLGPLDRWIKRLRVLRETRLGVRRYIDAYDCNEDLFWSDRAGIFDPSFRVAPVDVAVKFSFDFAPRRCFQMNGRQLPFGCHAWTKWDRPFWEERLREID